MLTRIYGTAWETSEQLEDALKKQVKEVISSGKRVSIGRILLNEGHITLQQLGVVLRTQG